MRTRKHLVRNCQLWLNFISSLFLCCNLLLPFPLCLALFLFVSLSSSAAYVFHIVFLWFTNHFLNPFLKDIIFPAQINELIHVTCKNINFMNQYKSVVADIKSVGRPVFRVLLYSTCHFCLFSLLLLLVLCIFPILSFKTTSTHSLQQSHMSVNIFSSFLKSKLFFKAKPKKKSPKGLMY